MPQKIVIVEPFYSGSHKRWCDELKKYSSHRIILLTLSGKHWKWRMSGGAVSLAAMVNKMTEVPDLFLASDMLDMAAFKGLLSGKFKGVPSAVYFHENQLAYPWSENDQDVVQKRDYHYLYKNFSSALAADKVLFNSSYNFNSFFETLPSFLKIFPDNNQIEQIEVIRRKSEILTLGIELPAQPELRANEPPVIAWNHRWEYDKNPEEFYRLLGKLKEKEFQFRLILLGERGSVYPKIFDKMITEFSNELEHSGFVESKEDYYRTLNSASILPVTSKQDFFGISIVEAMALNVIPILPNRLSYPMHVGSENLYNNFDELVSMVINYKKLTGDYRKKIEHYDWSNQIEKYDKILHEISNITQL